MILPELTFDIPRMNEDFGQKTSLLFYESVLLII